MPIYQTHGHLVEAIAAENIAAAQAYLTKDHEGNPVNMEQYLDPPLNGVVESLDWRLEGDGVSWIVTAFTTRALNAEELKKLSSEVSGQNSDGLGEGFEQQDFAWCDDSYEEDCGQCQGTGEVDNEDFEDENDDEQVTCGECDGVGYFDNEGGRMCSFDWESNDCSFVRIK